MTVEKATWCGAEISQTVEELFALGDLIASIGPEVVVEVGSPSVGLASFLVSMPTRCLILSRRGVAGTQLDKSAHRPSREASAALAEKCTLVYLDEQEPSTVFAWASALQPGSVVVTRNVTKHEWPDFGYVTCTLSETELAHTQVIRRQSVHRAAAEAPTKRKRPRRPLRSVFLGDLSYCSAYRLGITQGMSLLGAWHRDVNIRDGMSKIDQHVREMRPDVIFTHMLLWPPANKTPVYELLSAAEAWRREWNAAVIIHDGDPRERTRFPHDVSDAVDLALLNHSRVAEEWTVPTIYWPYAAFVQDEIGEPVPELQADLVFAGLMREDGNIYGPRTDFIKKMMGHGLKLYPGDGGVNNRMHIADLAPSCTAIVGFGRPEAPGWVDTRVFSVPGAGGVLIHDDVGGVLEPHEHYIPCRRYNVDSVLEALATAREYGDSIRSKGFDFIQSRHTYKHRCQQVLDLLFE